MFFNINNQNLNKTKHSFVFIQLLVTFRFGDDIEQMIGTKVNIYWKVIWKFVAPAIVLVLLVATLISKFINPITYDAYDSSTVSYQIFKHTSFI